MPIFRPFTETTPLPEEGTGYETETLDLKLSAELTTPFHRAKDIAAFANHLGGTLLVGFKEEHGRVAKCVGMTDAELDRAQKEIGNAIVQRCQPSPFVTYVPRRLDDDRFVLAINVWPHLNTLVGVKVDAVKDVEGYGGTAWVFPIRTVTNTGYLPAEQLAMFMSPEVRRAVILLSGIKTSDLVELRIFRRNDHTYIECFWMLEVDEQRNIVSFREREHPIGNPARIIPLDKIDSVYRDHRDRWCIVAREHE
jgi:hypothetical protein